MRYFCLHYSSKVYLFIASNDSIVNKLTLISSLTDWLVLDDKVRESSTSSNRISLLNYLKSNVFILFHCNNNKKMMIIIVDYNSKIFAIDNLQISQSLTVFNKCKNIFFQNGTQKGRITAADLSLPVTS